MEIEAIKALMARRLRSGEWPNMSIALAKAPCTAEQRVAIRGHVSKQLELVGSQAADALGGTKPNRRAKTPTPAPEKADTEPPEPAEAKTPEEPPRDQQDTKPERKSKARRSKR